MCNKFISFTLTGCVAFSFATTSSQPWATDFYNSEETDLSTHSQGTYTENYDFVLSSDFVPKDERIKICSSSTVANINLPELLDSTISSNYPIYFGASAEMHSNESDLNIQLTVTDNISENMSSAKLFGGVLSLTGDGVRDEDGNGVADYFELSSLQLPADTNPDANGDLSITSDDAANIDQVITYDASTNTANIVGAFDLKVYDSLDRMKIHMVDGDTLTLIESGASVISNNVDKMSINLTSVADIESTTCTPDTTQSYLQIEFNNYLLQHIHDTFNSYAVDNLDTDGSEPLTMCYDDSLECSINASFQIVLTYEDV